MAALNNSKKKNLKVNAVLNSVRAIFGLMFPLVSFPYSSRILGPVGLGKVNFSQSIISYFAMVAALGISSYGVREAAKVRDDKIALSKFVKELFLINLMSTFVAYILLVVAFFIVPKFSEYRNLIVLCSVSILFTTIGIEWLYMALEDYLYITVRSLIFQVISLVMLFVFVKSENDILLYAGIGVIGSVGSNICNFVHARSFVTFSTKEKLEFRKHLKPIFVLFSMSVAVSIYTALDTTMLGFLSGDEQVGYYSAATKINRMVLSVVTSAIAVLLPRLSYYISQGDEEKFSLLISKSINAIVLLSFPCTVGLSMVANQIILLFSGSQYEPATIVMRVMNPVIIAISFSNLIGIQIFMPLGKEKFTLLSVVIGAISNFTLNFFLIPRYGALGAAIATLVSESIVTIVQIILANRYLPWKSTFVNFFQCTIATIIMAVSVKIVSEIKCANIINLIVLILTGVVSYGLVLIIFKNTFLMEFINKGKRNGI